MSQSNPQLQNCFLSYHSLKHPIESIVTNCIEILDDCYATQVVVGSMPFKAKNVSNLLSKSPGRSLGSL